MQFNRSESRELTFLTSFFQVRVIHWFKGHNLVWSRAGLLPLRGTYRFWLSGSGAGPGTLHFQQAPRYYRCHWFAGHTLSNKILECSIPFILQIRKLCLGTSKWCPGHLGGKGRQGLRPLPGWLTFLRSVSSHCPQIYATKLSEPMSDADPLEKWHGSWLNHTQSSALLKNKPFTRELSSNHQSVLKNALLATSCLQLSHLLSSDSHLWQTLLWETGRLGAFLIARGLTGLTTGQEGEERQKWGWEADPWESWGISR